MDDWKFPVPSNFLQLNEEDSEKVINCLYSLINQRRNDINTLEDSQMVLKRLESDRRRYINDKIDYSQKIREVHKKIKEKDNIILFLKNEIRNKKNDYSRESAVKNEIVYKNSRLENQFQGNTNILKQSSDALIEYIKLCDLSKPKRDIKFYKGKKLLPNEDFNVDESYINEAYRDIVTQSYTNQYKELHDENESLRKYVSELRNQVDELINKQTLALADSVFSIEQIKKEAQEKEIIEMPLEYFKEQYLTYLGAKIQALKDKIDDRMIAEEQLNVYDEDDKPVLVIEKESV